jgi:hypothetical protein
MSSGSSSLVVEIWAYWRQGHGEMFVKTLSRLASAGKHVNCTPLNSTKPVNSNMSFGTGCAFPYDNVPLTSTSLQITQPFLWSQGHHVLFTGFTVVLNFHSHSKSKNHMPQIYGGSFVIGEKTLTRLASGFSFYPLQTWLLFAFDELGHCYPPPSGGFYCGNNCLEI